MWRIPFSFHFGFFRFLCFHSRFVFIDNSIFWCADFLQWWIYIFEFFEIVLIVNIPDSFHFLYFIFLDSSCLFVRFRDFVCLRLFVLFCPQSANMMMCLFVIWFIISRSIMHSPPLSCVFLCIVILCGAQDGRTALICAARNGRADCARLLLEAGADKSATDNVRASALCGWSVFSFCVWVLSRVAVALMWFLFFIFVFNFRPFHRRWFEGVMLVSSKSLLAIFVFVAPLILKTNWCLISILSDASCFLYLVKTRVHCTCLHPFSFCQRLVYWVLMQCAVVGTGWQDGVGLGQSVSQTRCCAPAAVKGAVSLPGIQFPLVCGTSCARTVCPDAMVLCSMCLILRPRRQCVYRLYSLLHWAVFHLLVSFIHVLVGCAVARACEFGGRIMQMRISGGQNVRQTRAHSS